MERRKTTECPAQGTPDNLFERLSEYISAFDKTWITEIEPASQEQIALFKEKIGFAKWGKEFPQDYQVFLKHMGLEDSFSWRVLNGGGFTNIEDLMEAIDEEPKFIPCHIPFFWDDMGDVPYYINMSGNPPHPIVG